MGVGTTITNAAYRLFRRFTRSADKAVERPDGPSEEAAEAADRELKDGAAESGKSFGDEAGKQARKPDGLNAFDRWGIGLVNKIIALAEKVRKWITKPRGKAKTAIAVGSAAVVAATASTLLYGPSPAPIPPPGPAVAETEAVVDIDIPPPLPEISPVPDDLTLSSDEFEALVSRLQISPLSLEALGRERLDLDVSDLPEPVDLPVAIAAASAAPVEVSVRQGGVTQSGTTTVQQLYETMPDARDQIEEAVRESGGSGLHVDIDVGTEFANIRIRS